MPSLCFQCYVKVPRTNVPNNPLDNLYFVNLDSVPNFSFLGCLEVRRKDGLRVGCAGYVVGCAGYVVGGLRRLCGGWFHENNATLWLHLASWDLPDSQLTWEYKMEPSVAICSGMPCLASSSFFALSFWLTENKYQETSSHCQVGLREPQNHQELNFCWTLKPNHSASGQMIQNVIHFWHSLPCLDPYLLGHLCPTLALAIHGSGK